MKHISVIIPIYNTGEALRPCLDSILAQDFADFECLLVDDGSRDHSPAIIAEYAARDSRFVPLRQPNGGVSSARNRGLDRACGEWVAFVDSDDCLAPGHLSALWAAAEEGVDLVLTGYRFLHPDRTTEHLYPLARYTGRQEVGRFLAESDFFSHQIPWDRMYRRRLLADHALRFDTQLSLSEDRLFCYHCLPHVGGIATTGQITYIHDGTDCSTLSYRLPPIAMQLHRSRVMAQAVGPIVEAFGLKPEGIFRLWAYNWANLKQALHTLAQTHWPWKAAGELRSCFEGGFDQVLFDRLQGYPRLAEQTGGMDDRLLLQRRFRCYALWVKAQFLMHKLHLR